MNDILNNMTEAEALDVVAGLGIFGALTAVIAAILTTFGIALYFIGAIGYYKMFQKAGEKGWKAFIPFYNDYIRFRIAWDVKQYWPYLISIIAVELLSWTDNFIVSLILLAAAVVAIVYMAKLAVYTAKAFGKGTGWGVLFLFFPFISSLIVGFGDAQYVKGQEPEITENF